MSLDPTLTPDAPDFKSANLFEAIENLKADNPRLETTEIDWYLQEDFARNERNRKAFSELKTAIDGMDNEFGWKTILKRIIKQIKL